MVNQCVASTCVKENMFKSYGFQFENAKGLHVNLENVLLSPQYVLSLFYLFILGYKHVK